MEKRALNIAWQMMKKAEKENDKRQTHLAKKMWDEKQEMLRKEFERRQLMLKKFNMVERKIKKIQEKAATQAAILHKKNERQVEVKCKIAEQKMYFQLFHPSNDTASKTLSVGTQIGVVQNYLSYQLNLKHGITLTLLWFYETDFQKLRSIE